MEAWPHYRFPPVVTLLLLACAASALGVDEHSCSSEGRALLQVAHKARQPAVVEDEPSQARQPAVVEQQPGFKVLVVGAPRTGTQSMAVALTRLGLHPAHTGIEREMRWPWCHYSFGNGSFEEAMMTMAGFDSAMDEPFHLVYEEVLRRFPACKFVLTEVEPEKWYKSVSEFMASHVHPNVTLVGPGTSEEELRACTYLNYFGCDFTTAQTPELKHRCISGYRAHSKRVRQLIPAEKLLVFNMSQGYGPLAEFLGKPVPNEPFPYADQFNTLRLMRVKPKSDAQ